MKHSQVKVHTMLLGSLFLWSSAFVGIKLALVTFSPGALALSRFLVASLCMFFIYSTQIIKTQVAWVDKMCLMAAGVIGIGLYNICLNYSELQVSAGLASFVIGLMPVISIILSCVFLKEHLYPKVWIGIVISLLGLSLLALGEGSSSQIVQGILLVLVSACCGALLAIVQKRFVRSYSAITVIAWVIWGGTLSLLWYTPLLTHELPNASLFAIGIVLYLGIFPAALAYWAWTYVLKHSSVIKASTSLYAMPFMSSALGFFIVDEKLSLISLLGGGLALFGALIAHRYQTSQEQPSIPPALLQKSIFNNG